MTVFSTIYINCHFQEYQRHHQLLHYALKCIQCMPVQPEKTADILQCRHQCLWKLQRNSVLMMCHYPDLGRASDCLKQISLAACPIRSTTQIWVVTRSSSVWNFWAHSSDLFHRETSGGVTKCVLFSQAVTITCTSVLKGKKNQNKKIIAHLPRVTLKLGNVIQNNRLQLRVRNCSLLLFLKSCL